MEARRLDRNTYDIFYGNGWDNHVRIRQGRENTYRIGGGRITHPELKELHEVLGSTAMALVCMHVGLVVILRVWRGPQALRPMWRAYANTTGRR